VLSLHTQSGVLNTGSDTMTASFQKIG